MGLDILYREDLANTLRSLADANATAINSLGIVDKDAYTFQAGYLAALRGVALAFGLDWPEELTALALDYDRALIEQRR